jgi:DNA-binding IclR family transcriptional regulator
MSTVPAASQTLGLLRTLAARGPSTAAALAAAIGIPRSSTYHLLSVLTDAGFVVHLADEHRWTLGPSAFEVGMAYLRHDPREALARPVLIELAERVGQTVHLAALHGAEVVYLLKESPRSPRRASTVITDVGVRLPAATTASGRAMLATLSTEQVRALMSSPTAFVSRTGRGPASLSALRTVLTRERRAGFAVEDGEILHGYSSVGVAIIDSSGRLSGAVSVTVRTLDDAANLEDVIALVPQVREAADAIAARLSG